MERGASVSNRLLNEVVENSLGGQAGSMEAGQGGGGGGHGRGRKSLTRGRILTGGMVNASTPSWGVVGGGVGHNRWWCGWAHRYIWP